MRDEDILKRKYDIEKQLREELSEYTSRKLAREAGIGPRLNPGRRDPYVILNLLDKKYRDYSVDEIQAAVDKATNALISESQRTPGGGIDEKRAKEIVWAKAALLGTGKEPSRWAKEKWDRQGFNVEEFYSEEDIANMNREGQDNIIGGTW